MTEDLARFERRNITISIDYDYSYLLVFTVDINILGSGSIISHEIITPYY